MNARVLSQVQTTAALCLNKVELVIPSYQRPYVWPSEDVVGLLDQIINACMTGEDHYYIGTVLTSRIPHRTGSSAAITYELIDGQQRMTTLMVLALAFFEISPTQRLKDLAVLGTSPRLVFAIREEVQTQLGIWAGLIDSEQSTDLEKKPYLKHLIAAHKAAKDRLQMFSKDHGPVWLASLEEFLFNQVKWVNNVMPADMDLNGLFATLNTSGIQLEQTDILKARLMDKIVHYRACYEGIWQACENMDNYFERSLRRVFPEAAWDRMKFANLESYSREIFSLERPVEGRGNGLTIAEISVKRVPRNDTDPVSSEETDDENDEGSVQSIISFGLLLMHTYRIYRHRQWGKDIGTPLNDSRLNSCFESFVDNASVAQAREFIECLWQVRYQFDLWVVKWVRLAEEKEKHLRLTTINKRTVGKLSASRAPELHTPDLAQLQSVRYFTGDRSAQYWLTPFLGALIDDPTMNPNQVDALLERIDNQLSIIPDTITQKMASFALLSGDCVSSEHLSHKIAYLKEPNGTGFEHYWFQKLEYILWRERHKLGCFQKESLESYRIASRNSVEHVHPQNEEFMNRLEDDYLHSFGNLVLLSPGDNSSYSNQAVLKKQADFRAKPRYDSLKLAHMFDVLGKGDDWGKDQIERHRGEMIEMIQAHYLR